MNKQQKLLWYLTEDILIPDVIIAIVTWICTKIVLNKTS